jgi:hypothetical protein
VQEVLTPIFFSLTFWVPIVIALLFSIGAVIIIGKVWVRKVPGETKVTLNSEALRSSINSGITVGGLVLPLAISLIAYLEVQLQQSQHDLAVLFASVVIIFLAVCAGVFNVYSIATLTQLNGGIEISATKSTYVPAQFVLQIVLLLAGLLMLAVFCFFFLNPSQVGAPASQAGYDLPILRSSLRVGQSMEEVEASWGRPSTRKDTPTESTLTYNTPTSVFTIAVRGGKVAVITERQKEGQ